jgi:hypothetical protein
MNNGPISASAPGTSLAGANAKNVTFSTRYPFHKLDSTNSNSFEILTIFLSKDTPNPVTPTSTATFSNTLVYSFPHGYTYVPSTWFLISTNNFTTTTGSEGSIIYSSPTSQVPNSTNAILNIQVDATNVYFYVLKQWGYVFGAADPNPPTVLGMFVAIRNYIFVEDLLGGSVPSQP